jgi:hypothetical protein
MRHVVQGRVELARQRRLALAPDEGADENLLQARRDMLDADKEQYVEQPQSEIIGAALENPRQRQRPASKQRLQMENPWPAVGAACAGCHVAERDRRTDHM